MGLVLVYIKTTSTHYYLESSGRVAYMATHLKGGFTQVPSPMSQVT